MKLERPDIGACYCKADDPNRCRWDEEERRWVGPCDAVPYSIEVEPCTDSHCRYVDVFAHYHRRRRHP